MKFNDNILVCIFNYRNDANARRWRNILSPYVETVVLDSGNVNVHGDFIQFPNIYYSGLWNEAVKLSGRKNYKWVGIICSDVEIDEENANKIVDRIEWLNTTKNVGLWQAGGDSTSRSVHGLANNDGDFQYKLWLEGWFLFIRGSIFSEVGAVDTSVNLYGWYLDTFAETICHNKGMLSLMDNICRVHHPSGCGYNQKEARKQGVSWYNDKMSSSGLTKPTTPIIKDVEYEYDVTFVIPIRGREDMRPHMERNLKSVYGDKYRYKIMYIEQDNDGLFRLGQLRNVGAILSDTDYIILQDVDILHLRPVDIKKVHDDNIGYPVRLFNAISQVDISENEEYTITSTMRRGGTGACVLFGRDEWNKFNGYSNLYRGWGVEDDTFREYSKIHTYVQDLGHITHPKSKDVAPAATAMNTDVFSKYVATGLIDHYDDGWRQMIYTISSHNILSDNVEIYKISSFGVINSYKHKDIYDMYEKYEPDSVDTYKRNRKAVYTCITGGYDVLNTPEFITAGWDYICYTDNANISSDVWEFRPIPDELCDLSNVKKQRCVKIRSDKYLGDYDLTVWVDGNLKITGNLDDFVRDAFGEKNTYIAIKSHPVRNCVYDEMDACVRYGKETQDRCNSLRKRYVLDGMPFGFGMYETCVMVRKSNKKLSEFLEMWEHELVQNSSRDQLSVTYCEWKLGIHGDISSFKHDIQRRYFLYNVHISTKNKSNTLVSCMDENKVSRNSVADSQKTPRVKAFVVNTGKNINVAGCIPSNSELKIIKCVNEDYSSVYSDVCSNIFYNMCDWVVIVMDDIVSNQIRGIQSAMSMIIKGSDNIGVYSPSVIYADNANPSVRKYSSGKRSVNLVDGRIILINAKAMDGILKLDMSDNISGDGFIEYLCSLSKTNGFKVVVDDSVSYSILGNSRRKASEYNRNCSYMMTKNNIDISNLQTEPIAL